MTETTEKKPKIWTAKKVSLGASIAFCVAIFIIGIVLGANFNSYAPYLGINTSSSSVQGNKALNYSSLNDVYNKLLANYDGEIDENKLLEGAKKGLTEALGDIYTVYMDKEESSAFDDSIHGNVGGGIGIEFGIRNNYPTILRTLPDNPARRAGLLAGDIIYKVNDEEVITFDSDLISSKTRGEIGSEITLTIIRNGEEKTFTMVREEINNVSAYSEIKGDTAIITVTRFDTDTGALVTKFAKNAVNENVSKIILDLRNNGGGYVSAAKEILSLWIEGAPILYERSIHYQADKVTYASNNKAILKGKKTIVLVNGSTASASEITAGALKDYGLATVVGEQTFGKGVVQQLFNMPGNCYLKVTTASWYTPNLNTINKEGIKPDVEVEMTYDDINNLRDPQLDKALSL